MKKRVFSLLLALTLLLCALPLPVHAAANEITVYNWGQYISDGTDESLDVIQAFEEETGIKVNYLTFDSNESMYTKLKTGGTTFDVIIPSDYMIAKLISEDMLEPLDFANIPNYEYIDEAFRDQAYDPQNAYSVPYTWGTVGLIYNKNYVSEEDAQSWSCLWNSKYQGKLLMFDNPRDAFAIAESMLGYSFNTEDEQEFKNCADLLATQSPVLQGYVMDQIFDRMERGDLPPGGVFDIELFAEGKKLAVRTVDELILLVPDIKMVKRQKFFFQIKGHRALPFLCYLTCRAGKGSGWKSLCIYDILLGLSAQGVFFHDQQRDRRAAAPYEA